MQTEIENMWLHGGESQQPLGAGRHKEGILPWRVHVAELRAWEGVFQGVTEPGAGL